MSKYLVLGAGGFIGKRLVAKLCTEHDVIAYDRKLDSSFENIKRVTSVVGNFTTENNWTRLLEDVEVVYHLISTTVPIDQTDHICQEISDNVLPTVLLLEAMKECGVKTLVFISSGGTIYGPNAYLAIPEECPLTPISSYGVQKQVIENYINFYNAKYNMNLLIARVSNPYGIGHNLKRQQGIIPIFLSKVLNHESITIFGDGENIRDYIYMDDLIAALIKLAAYGGMQKVFNIGSGIGHSINQVLSEIIRITGVKDVNIVNTQDRSCDVRRNVLDITKVKNALEWAPQYSLEEGIKMLYTSHHDKSIIREI